MNKHCRRMTKEQLLETAQALIAFAHGKPVQYFSEINGWSDCETVDTEFPHRPKPEQADQPTHKEPPSGPVGPECFGGEDFPSSVSLRVEDY